MIHPYKISLHQELSEEDYPKPINFCLWAQERMNEHPDSFNYILWCDEVIFRSNGKQYGAPPHYDIGGNTFNEQFPDEQKGQGATDGYPARTPDTTCLDYLCGRLKCEVYATRRTTREDMMEMIRNVVTSISPEDIQRSVRQLQRAVGAWQTKRDSLSMCTDFIKDFLKY
ncbi:hypothetical protein J6590_072393 [Homalodisca vitripennis]|nr:hypothetical protein J6590_072393 [Homalodisca vitripennis]